MLLENSYIALKRCHFMVIVFLPNLELLLFSEFNPLIFHTVTRRAIFTTVAYVFCILSFLPLFSFCLTLDIYQGL